MKLYTEVVSFSLSFVPSCEYSVGWTFLSKFYVFISNILLYLIYLLFFILYVHFSPHSTENKA